MKWIQGAAAVLSRGKNDEGESGPINNPKGQMKSIKLKCSNFSTLECFNCNNERHRKLWTYEEPINMANDKIQQINKNIGSMADKLASFEGKCKEDERD